VRVAAQRLTRRLNRRRRHAGQRVGLRVGEHERRTENDPRLVRLLAVLAALDRDRRQYDQPLFALAHATPEPQPRPEADDPPRVNATLAALRRQQQAVAQRVVVKQRPGAHPALPAVRRQQLPRRLLQPLAIPRTALRALGLRRPALRLRHHDLLGVGPARRGPVPPPPHPRTGANLGRPGPAAGRRDRKLARQALEEARSRNSAAAARAIKAEAKRAGEREDACMPSRPSRSTPATTGQDLRDRSGPRACPHWARLRKWSAVAAKLSCCRDR
jgi:hypothetical protein